MIQTAYRGERQVDTHALALAGGHQDGLRWAHRRKVVLVLAQVHGPVPLQLHEGIVARGGADLVQQRGAHLREPQL